jgi:hypothetical protein
MLTAKPELPCQEMWYIINSRTQEGFKVGGGENVKYHEFKENYDLIKLENFYSRKAIGTF